MKTLNVTIREPSTHSWVSAEIGEVSFMSEYTDFTVVNVKLLFVDLKKISTSKDRMQRLVKIDG